MKFCPVVPDICRGQVHGARKERRRIRRIRIIIIITRYDYNLMIMKCHIFGGSKRVGVTMGNLKFCTLMLITSNWIMIET
jgi:hypothetical protein